MTLSVSAAPLADSGHLADVLVAGMPHVTEDRLHRCGVHHL